MLTSKGRTARIGNTGTAYSFYDSKNEDLAEPLVKILLESKQKVPDFLDQYKPPEEGELNFDDNSDDEAEPEAEGDAAEGGDAGADDAW